MAIKRYDARLVADVCGNKDVIMKESHDGLFVRYEDCLAELRRVQREHQSELNDAARSAADERTWQMIQGEDYGSY